MLSNVSRKITQTKRKRKLVGFLSVMAIITLLMGIGHATSVGKQGILKPDNKESAQVANTTMVPSLVVIPNANVLSRDTKIVISGAGFEPGEEIVLLMQLEAPDVGIQMSDIWENLDPKPVANERGSWTTILNCNEYVLRKYVKQDIYTLYVCEPYTYKVIATAPLLFADTSKVADQWPAWANIIFKK